MVTEKVVKLKTKEEKEFEIKVEDGKLTLKTDGFYPNELTYEEALELCLYLRSMAETIAPEEEQEEDDDEEEDEVEDGFNMEELKSLVSTANELAEKFGVNAKVAIIKDEPYPPVNDEDD